MKIKLKALRLPSTTATLRQKVDPADSKTEYQAQADGTFVCEVYYQEKTGVLGGERLGVEFNIWLPKAAIPNIVPTRNDKMTIFDRTYELIDIQEKILSNFEDHWEINIFEPNE